jgi:putative NADPH-quinone reductase
MSRRFLFISASARSDGNTEFLARRAAQFLPPYASADWHDLRHQPLPAFEDHRHDLGYGPVSPEARPLLDKTMAASDIVLVAPLYWYGLPASAKLYLDHWSHWMRLQGSPFKALMGGKDFWLIMAHSGSTPEQIFPATECFRLSAQYFGGTYRGALLADANRPGEAMLDKRAMAAAETFFAA